MITEIFVNTSLAILSAMMGAAILFVIKINHERLCALISLSAGALLGAGLIVILPETLENLSFISVIISVGSGYLLFWLISKYYFHVCPACSASHFDSYSTQKFTDVVKMLFTALAIHSFFDGLAITAEHGHVHHAGEAGHAVLTAILVHKFPEGLALASLMIGANYAKNKVILYVFLVELTTLLGGIAGYFLLSSGNLGNWVSLIEAHIAGGFIFLAIHALLGETFKNHTGKVVLYFSIGIAIIAITRFIF